MMASASSETSVDIASHLFPPKMEQKRLLETSADELTLALKPSPSESRERWINPRLSAVYVLSNEANSLHKIGFADNLKNRFSGIDCCCPIKISLEHFIYFVGRIVTSGVEAEVHRILSDRRRKGEWFEVSKGEAAQAIASVIDRRKLFWWTEQERRDLGTQASQVHMDRTRNRGIFCSN